MNFSKTIIIAEAGVNHNGDMAIAKQLIEAAAAAGADMVKFQTFKTEELVSPDAPKADYQKQNTGNTESQFDMLKRLELNEQQHLLLMEHCRLHKIEFLSTPFDIPSIDLLAKLKLQVVKIPSGEINNVPYLRHIAGKFEHYILSTGMSDMEEIKFAMNELEKKNVNRNQITVLHCNTEYPTQMSDVNLKAMNKIAEKLNVKVGYSDHTIGYEVGVAAVALGAVLIEKHFTIDKTMIGPDHKASLEPDELKTLVEKIRNIETALGSSEKLISASALKNAAVAKKSIVAKTAIKKGEPFTETNLTVKRPGNGISPMKWDEVVGKIAERDFNSGEIIS